MHSFFSPCLLAAAVAAQIPTDAAVVLESTLNITSPNFQLVDALGRGTTTVRGQNVFLQPGPVSVAVDPTNPANFFFQASPLSFAGTWRCETTTLATIRQSVWGAWLRAPGQRVEAGATQVFTLRDGVVEAWVKTASAPQTPVTLFTLQGAIDLAVREPFLYVASFDASFAVPLVEYNLLSNTQRTVGSYPGVSAIAASPTSAELLLGSDSGALTQIDPATGNVLNSTNPRQGPILAVGYTSRGVRLYATGNALFSEAVTSGPIYQTQTTILDFGVGLAPTASIVPYGTGCGAGAAAAWSSSGLPTLGNQGFQLGLQSAPLRSVAVLALGTDRQFSSVLGAALPFDLGPLGAVGCSVLADPQVTFALATTSGGSATLPLPIPASLRLGGRELAAQWFVPDNSIGPLGLATSEGAALAVR